MNDPGTVNDQIIDNANSVSAMVAGQTPAHAFAMLDTVMLETLGMAMYNAVNRQQNAGMLNSAAVTAACARMLNAHAPAPPPPAPAPPPVVQPLPGPSPSPSGAAAVMDAYTQGNAAIATLQGMASASGALAQEAATDLHSLAQAASAPTPAPTPAPAPTPTPTPAP
ncbi:translation initiation factor 2 [Duganella sp. FT50W]|uniref:Translation initiation factor 2 n=1 Tax=Duganella lactea TaxID=2692173 RepID=A0A6L8MEC1_9BURK|nr:RebB family R body protein [Duganella lactea]MYM81307.1 translation initiation factor 2 [Duganella lactea]